MAYKAIVWKELARAKFDHFGAEIGWHHLHLGEALKQTPTFTENIHTGHFFYKNF